MSDQYLYIGITAAITVANTIIIWILWRELKNLRDRVEHNHTAQQRQGREISQHRYSIALLSQSVKNNDIFSRKKKSPGEIKADEKEDEITLSKEDVEAELNELTTTTEDIPETEFGSTSVSFDRMKDAEILEFVKKAVRNNHVALAMQPIVILPDRQVAYYEVFSRIQVQGQDYIPAHKYLAVAKNNNLMGALDNLLMVRCLQLLKDKAEKAEANVEFFLNTNPQTFVNKDYLSGLVRFLAANPRLSSKLVFEMTQEDWITLSPSVKAVMDNLSLLGCRFSMDQINILGMDMARMMKQNISFVKLDATTLIKEIQTSGDVGRVKRIKNALDAQRINVILEKVENEKQLTVLHDLHPDFAQGYLFGGPDIIP